MQFAISDNAVSELVNYVFRTLPAKEREHVENKIAAVTDADLTTAVRPFMFGGRVVHELYFDPSKLLFFTREEKIGAVVSAFVISSLAQNGDVPLSDQTLRTHDELIMRSANRLKYGTEVSLFLRRFMTLENEWRQNTFPDIRDEDEV